MMVTVLVLVLMLMMMKNCDVEMLTPASMYSEWLCRFGLGGDDDDGDDCSGLGGDDDDDGNCSGLGGDFDDDEEL